VAEDGCFILRTGASCRVPHLMKRKSFSHAVKWSYAATWGEKAFGAFFTFFLAALLGPKDFGVVSIAVVYVLFLQMLLDQGLATALIQKKDLEPDHVNAVFWADMSLSLVFVGASILLSRWWAAVNHAPQAAAIISVLSLCIPIEGLAIVQKSLLSREMNFKSLSIRSNVSVLIGGGIGVGMAYAGWGVWALVGQQITRDLTALILLWRLSRWRPRLAFSWKHLKDLMGFSVSNFIAQLGVFADTYASAIVLGLFFGPVAVGLYRLADRVMSTVLSAATSSIQAVSLPEFSRFQDQPIELRKSVLTCIRLSSTVTLPALAGVAAVSASLMATVGAQWIPATGVLQILCVLGMFFVFAFFTGPLLQALAKVKLAAALEWARTLAGIGLLLLAGFVARGRPISYQIMGIALARFVIGALLVTPVFLYLLMRLSGIAFRDLFSSIAPSMLASMGVVLSVLLFHSLGWLSTAKPAVLLAAEVFVGGITGLPILLLLDVQLRGAIARLIKRRTGFDVVAKELA
jgi:polysaccharide transporter, PST family